MNLQKTVKLTSEEIKHIASLPNIGKRKDWVQNHAINIFRYHPIALLRMFTGCGKGTLIVKVIQLMNLHNPKSTICIIVPSQKLYDDALKDIKDNNLLNVDLFIVNTYSFRVIKDGWKPEYDLLVVDEADIVANSSSLFFSECIPHTKFKFFLGLSATFTIEQLAFFKNLGIELLFDLPIHEGYQANMVPDYTIYNIPVELKFGESRTYAKCQEDYMEIVYMFKKYDPTKPLPTILACIKGYTMKTELGNVKITAKVFSETVANHFNLYHKTNLTGGQIIGKAMEWQRLMNFRKKIIIEAKNAYAKVLEIALSLENTTIIFAPSILLANQLQKELPNSICSHSKITPKNRQKNLDAFEADEYKYLIVIKSLDRGYDLQKIKYSIQWGFTSKSGTADQRIGRQARFDEKNPDKYAIMYCVFVDNFVLPNGKEVKSQQKVWLHTALRGKPFVEWLQLNDSIPT